jgi:hypothetical protein
MATLRSMHFSWTTPYLEPLGRLFLRRFTSDFKAKPGLPGNWISPCRRTSFSTTLRSFGAEIKGSIWYDRLRIFQFEALCVFSRQYLLFLWPYDYRYLVKLILELRELHLTPSYANDSQEYMDTICSRNVDPATQGCGHELWHHITDTLPEYILSSSPTT